MMDAKQKKNKALCERYPFLIPRNVWTGKRITDGAGYWSDSDKVPEYNYEWTLLDNMPEGWRKAFGEQMCEEMREALIDEGRLDDYVITDIKEKYGGLRWYSYGETERTIKIIHKYEELSHRTCIRCGAPATVVTTGWINPYCDDCLPRDNNAPDDHMSIEEYFDEVTDYDEDTDTEEK